MRRFGSLGVFVLWLGLALSAHAQPGTRDLSRDVLLTMQARRLLYADPDLTALNFGVSVERRVATLFGPKVPSAEAIFRAELCLRGMVGLVEVRNELFVSDLLAPADAPLKLKAPPLEPRDLAPPMLPREPSSIFSRPDVHLGQDLKALKVPTAHKTSQAKPPSLTSAAVEPDLASAVRAVLASKNAYKIVAFTIQDRHVYLSAPEDNPDALLEAGRAIARLPGVDGVILLDRSAPR